MKKRFSINKNKITIFPKTVNKTINAPASKSVMQRAVALALLSSGRTVIKNPSFSNDSLSVIRIAGALGASIRFTSDEFSIERTDGITETKLNFGESGLALRMFSSIISLFDKEFILNGKGTLIKRPVIIIENSLKQLGVTIKSDKGYLPIKLSGKLKNGKIEIDGSFGSQVLTGLLIALPILDGDSEIIVNNLKSKPYIDLTIKMINDFGVKVKNNNYKKFIIKGNQKYFAQDYIIEGDWSSASFLLVAGLIAGEVKVTGLNTNSKQADKEILTAIKLAGGYISINLDSIIASKSKLSAFEFDATNCPDLFPPLVTMAAYCKGTSIIKGVSRLKHKESDRANVLKSEFAKIGIKIETNDDSMIIHGGKVTGGTINSYNDHRIAMAISTAALGAKSEITILNADSINKSYSKFYRDIK